MKYLVLVVLIVLTSGCAVNMEKYNAGKEVWEGMKVKENCVQEPGDFSDHRPAFRDGAVWGPSLQRYTKWNCDEGKVYYSPYEWWDAIHQERQQSQVSDK